MITAEQKAQFNALYAEYVVQVKTWKQEWLRQSPPMELVHYLSDPPKYAEKRQKEWDGYVMGRATSWWKEKGWEIQFGKPDEGCRFSPISKTDGTST